MTKHVSYLVGADLYLEVIFLYPFTRGVELESTGACKWLIRMQVFLYFFGN